MENNSTIEDQQRLLRLIRLVAHPKKTISIDRVIDSNLSITSGQAFMALCDLQDNGDVKITNDKKTIEILT